jgi:hypothetical protein
MMRKTNRRSSTVERGDADGTNVEMYADSSFMAYENGRLIHRADEAEYKSENCDRLLLLKDSIAY